MSARPASAPRSLTAASVEARRISAHLREDVRLGHLSLAEALVHPRLANRMLVELVRWQWFSRGGTARPALTELGRLAVRDGVNLLQPASGASTYTRAWVVEHGAKWTRRAAA